MLNKDIITICSDATFSYKYKDSAWACYIRSNEKRILKSGVLKGEIKNTTSAERRGLANALKILDMTHDLKGKKLIIYCDNKYVLHPLNISRGKNSRSLAKKEMLEQRIKDNEILNNHIEPILKKAKEYEYRHVKGHLKESDWHTVSKRNFMNDWCDKKAKETIIKHREKNGYGIRTNNNKRTAS